MPFFQNPFFDDFKGSILLGDRQHIPDFDVKGNNGRGKEIVYAWNRGPYNLSGNDADGDSRANLQICFSLYHTKNWATLTVDVTSGAASTSAVTGAEIVAALNANTLFKERFVAIVGSYDDVATKNTVSIRSKKSCLEIKFYILNGGAEEALGFNARAGVAELPSFLDRHSIDNRFTYTDSQGLLVKLDPATSDVAAALIDGAVDYKGVSLGYDSASPKADWQLFAGKSGIFQFSKGPGTGAVSTTETTTTYPSGAKVGDLAKRTIVQKNAGGAVVATYELPYTLESADLITPP